MTSKKWEVKNTDNIIVQKLAKDLGVSKIIAHLLVLRGVTTFDQAKTFFRPELSHLNNPFLMKDMKKAVERVEIANKKKEKILVYGDYDVDGTTSVSMMYSFLKRYNQNIDHYIPCRYEEGYGISFKSIEYAKQNKVSLIIALDCGIKDIDQVAHAKELGIDFIICDHHTALEDTPNAIAVLNPKQKDCKYPYKELSGCGVGFKLIQGYCENNEIPFKEIIEYLDLLVVSIGADIVPMTGENRVLAFYGLRQINETPRAGLKAIMNISCKTESLTIEDIIFRIAPRINAAGRIEHAKQAVQLLIENDPQNARLFADLIEESNKTRKNLDQSVTAEALGMIKENKKSTVLFSHKWHKGIVGIVASRLVERYYKPTIVFSEKNGVLTGSARSVHDFDLYEAISKCSHLCESFGGHKYAAGLTVKKENLKKFTKEFELVVSKTIIEDQLTPKIEVDMEININDINVKLFRIIKQFSPFGPLNPSPVFVSKQVMDNGYAKKIGPMKSHLKLYLQKEKDSIEGIGFGMADFFDNITNSQLFDVCYYINENTWNGRKNLQLRILDFNNSSEMPD